MQKIIFFILLSLVFWACQAPETESKQSKIFFDLEAFLAKQIIDLDKNKPFISKTINTDGKEESKKVKLQDWEKELKPFIKADINRPAWQDSYSIKDSTTKKGNWKVYQAIVKQPVVRSLKVLQNNSEVLRVIAEIQDNNYLYQSSQLLNLYFEKSKLKKYTFKGEQRLFYGDYEEYFITGEVLE